MTHADYFKKKGVVLEYPDATPMIEVPGRRDQKIYLPPELVMANELDPKVREQLPQIASFEPKVRNEAIEKIKNFLVPGAQKTKNAGGLLPAIGIILTNERLSVEAKVLAIPYLVAGGIPVPESSGQNWGPKLSNANFRVNPNEATELNVVLFYSHRVDRGHMQVFAKIRDFVNRCNSKYRLSVRPVAAIPVGDQADHWGAVEKYFSNPEVPDNVFVIDFVKPFKALDTAYPVVKQMLTKSGFLSQFVNFKTYAHDNPRDQRKSDMCLQGVARQILQKAGVS
jgi:hypothetical protein